MTYADVIVPIPLSQLLTYSIPDTIENKMQPGMRVTVSLGSKKLYTGIVFSIHNNKPEYKTKNIEDALDDVPILNKNHLDLWKWISDYYACTLGEVMRAGMPASLKPESETYVIACADYNETLLLTPTEQSLFNNINADIAISINNLAKTCNTKSILSTLNNLHSKGRITFQSSMKREYVPVFSEHICIKHDTEHLHKILNDLQRAPRQLEVVNFLIENHLNNPEQASPSVNTVIKQTGVTRNIINSLVKKDIINIEQIEVSRFKSIISNFEMPKLSAEQIIAFDAITKSFKKGSKTLLHGVTGSGKTEIYIHCIKQTLEQNKQALYLLPEIALTTQIIRRLQKAFGNTIGVFHSKYPDSARAEVWKRLQKNEYQVILGVRSAVFLPFSNLGLVIIDEEHETSYKQFDPAPRYHARDTAIVLASLFNAKTLLGTATPSIETHYNTITGKYAYVELNTRFKNVAMPDIQVVDLTDAYKRRIMQEHFHPELIFEIKTALHRGEQVILFQNRRGYAPYVECKDCGWIPQCKQCNVNYTYHKFGHRLICHYCGANTEMPIVCPDCGSKKVSNRGFGTEMLEDEATIFFPEASIKRMDSDTTGTRKKYEQIIHDFEEGKIDILIGTQMVTKGLDFENVGVVGILNADSMLNFPNFRAYERSYQLMAQVSGRAGRKHKQGKVIIQTREPKHPIIEFVVQNNYSAMFADQIEERKLFKYPPFYKFIIIKIKHKDSAATNRIALQLSNVFRTNLGEAVSLPIEPLVGKIFNYYIKEILIRLAPDKTLASKKRYIFQYVEWMVKQKEHRGVKIQTDVDPM
jgi:primosomal protein N' (replication factor Y)